ncbi:MAG: division/cell wall cluster transcriptional repressor MraZ [Pirellulales bacterium]|nr:division/cell wall cluster transcriptional repressor MraZ [Pirellulales bacterium]
MAPALITGEFRRLLDDRFRISLPQELEEKLAVESGQCMLIKERVGCLGLWNAQMWQAKLEADVELVKSKLAAGKLHEKIGELQLLGRLLSTRDASVTLDDRRRLLVPDGFRQFLGVEPGSEVMVVGAGVSIEIWNPRAWLAYVRKRMPKFRKLLNHLSR